MKAFKYVLGYLLLIQLALPYLLPFDLIFRDRMDYNLVKDNLSSIDVILDNISRQIRQEHLENYIIILGDSVAYSGPGDASQSIGHYMQDLADESSLLSPPRIYNLSMPAMQMGDIYTMLLKLDEHQISTQNLIVDVAYQGFVVRNPDPAIVFWLQEDLKALDRVSYDHVLGNLEANTHHNDSTLQTDVHKLLWENVAILRCSGFVKKGMLQEGRAIIGAGPMDDSIGDARVWSAKPGLREFLRQAEYERDFSPQDFDLSNDNPQIYFLDNIIAHQQGKHTLVFMAAANQELMNDKVSAPGYVRNLQQVDNYFKSQPVQYINMYGQINSDLFSDHLHLVADGYRELARMLWDNFEKGDRS